MLLVALNIKYDYLKSGRTREKVGLLRRSCSELASQSLPRFIIDQPKRFCAQETGTSPRCRCSSVEVELSVALLDDLLVGLLEVFGHDYISVLTHSLHTSFLSDRLDICS